jgi:hypothetical protein
MVPGELEIRFADLKLREDAGHARHRRLLENLRAERLLVKLERGATVAHHEIRNYLPIVWSSSDDGHVLNGRRRGAWGSSAGLPCAVVEVIVLSITANLQSPDDVAQDPH